MKRQKKHKDSVEGSSKQSKFIVKDGDVSLVNKDGKSKTLSTEDMTTKAEICCCLDIIDSNCSFWAADADNEKYRKMFPDSAIANSYKQKSDKVKYMLQFGVAPFMRSVILNELKGLPFSFRFDETTTSQVKKQYDAYATYNSKHFGRIITVYLGTLFVGKFTSEDLLNHLNDMLNKIQLSFNCILSLGMDGPIVNLVFKSKLEIDLEKHKKTLMDVGTCPLRVASNAFCMVNQALVQQRDTSESNMPLLIRSYLL